MRIERAIIKNLKEKEISIVSNIIKEISNRDIWLDYDTISLEYPELCYKGIISNTEIDALEKEKATCIVLRRNP